MQDLVENFFYYDNRHYHEIAMYFLMNLPQDSPVRRRAEFRAYDDGKGLTFRWQPLDALDELIIQPSFLKTGLNHLPVTTEHIVHIDKPV